LFLRQEPSRSAFVRAVLQGAIQPGSRFAWQETAVLLKSGGRRSPVISVAVDDRTPTGITIGVGSVAVVAAASVAALIPPRDAGWRFAVVAGVLGLFAALTRSEWAVAAMAALSWFVVNGFLVNRAGELSWHGSPDLLRLMLLVLIGGSGLALGQGIRGLREARARWRAGAYVAALATENNEKEKRDA
jgi:hypothetical protein